MFTFTIRDLLDFVGFTARRFRADHCAATAASLTFSTLLSLVPFATIALALVSAFPVFEQFTASVKAFLLAHMVPESAGRIITGYTAQFSEKAAQLTALGIALLGAAAFSLMYTINSAFNAIWRVRRPRPWLKRLLAYWAVLTLGPIMIGASLTLTAFMVRVTTGAANWADILLQHFTPVALTVLAFYLMYAVIPNRRAPRAHALAGALIGALLFELMKRGFAAYIALFPTYTFIYGAFAAVPIFLLWLYLSWIVVMLGAEIAASLTFWPGASPSETAPPAVSFAEALRVLYVLSAPERAGQLRSITELQAAVPIGLGSLERILARLCAERIVVESSDGSYLIARDPKDIQLIDVWRSFKTAPPTAPGSAEVDSIPLSERLACLDRCAEACLQGSLANLRDATAPPRSAPPSDPDREFRSVS